jgi:hypothetical protein
VRCIPSWSKTLSLQESSNTHRVLHFRVETALSLQ